MNKLLLPALLLLAGCASIPKAELSAYADSFEAAQMAAGPIIADYAVAERATRMRVLRDSRLDCAAAPCPRRFEDGYFSVFEVGDVAAASTIGLPPASRSLERAFGAIAAYNDTLVALAEGRNVDEARGQLRSAVADLDVLAGVAAPELAGLDTIASTLLTVLQPAIAEGNRKLFARQVLAGHPKVVELIHLMRNFTPTQFLTITTPLRRKLGAAPADQQAELKDSINRWHTVFADYVVLLEAMEGRLGEIHQMALDPRRETRLARASRGAAGLRLYAETLRRSLDELHAVR